MYGSWYYLFLADALAELQAFVYGDAGGIPDDTDTLFVATSGPLAEDLVGGFDFMDFVAQNGGYPVIVDDYRSIVARCFSFPIFSAPENPFSKVLLRQCSASEHNCFSGMQLLAVSMTCSDRKAKSISFVAIIP